MNNNPDFGFYHSELGSPTAGTFGAPIDASVNLDVVLKDCSIAPEPKSIADSIGALDSLCYIYTSGTTGLPKAVDIKHIR